MLPPTAAIRREFHDKIGTRGRLREANLSHKITVLVCEICQFGGTNPISPIISTMVEILVDNLGAPFGVKVTSQATRVITAGTPLSWSER